MCGLGAKVWYTILKAQRRRFSVHYYNIFQEINSLQPFKSHPQPPIFLFVRGAIGLVGAGDGETETENRNYYKFFVV